MEGKNVYLDSSAILKRYLKEGGSGEVDRIFLGAESRNYKIYFSVWNVGEVVGILDKEFNKMKGKFLQDRIGDFLNELDRLVSMGAIETVEINMSAIFQAIRLVVKYRIYIADALQIVSYKQAGCDSFLTGDRRLSEVAGAEGLSCSCLG